MSQRGYGIESKALNGGLPHVLVGRKLKDALKVALFCTHPLSMAHCRHRSALTTFAKRGKRNESKDAELGGGFVGMHTLWRHGSARRLHVL